MKPTTKILLALAALLLLTGGAIVYAQTGGDYDLSWNTVDGGAMFSTGGSYSLGGTIGQPDAGMLSGGGYTLVGGFWGGGVVDYEIYLPLLMK
jgi:hypothetical protein